MDMFLTITLIWLATHVVVGILRFGILKDYTELKYFILFDVIGTYLTVWACALLAWLVSLVI